MKFNKDSILTRSITGAVGKQFVVKHYGKKVVFTKYPDMTNIKPTQKQIRGHELFRQAVAYAQQIIANPNKKTLWQKRLKRKNGVYNEAIKFFLLRIKHKKERAQFLADALIRKSLKNNPAKERVQLFEITHILHDIVALCKEPCGIQVQDLHRSYG